MRPLFGSAFWLYRAARLTGLFGAIFFLSACQPENSNVDADNGVVAASTASAQRSEARPEVRVVTSGGFAAAYDTLQHQIENELSILLHTEYGSSSGGAPDSIPERLKRGEKFDVIILSRSALGRLTEQGYVAPESKVDLVRSTIGMAVKQGADIPDISTTEKFTQVLTSAESIGYSASASGTYLSTVLLPKMDLWETLAPKSIRILSERVATVVARSDVEIGFQQVSEILPIEGVEFAGQIPDALQRVTTFSAGVLSAAENSFDAQRLLDYLSSAELAAQIKATGLSPIVLESFE